MDVQRDRVGSELAAMAPVGPSPASGEVLARLPGRASWLYAAVGASWIIASDLLMAAAAEEDLAERIPEIAKGLAFVLGTALVLWVVLRRLTGRFDRMVLQALTAQRDFYGSVLATGSDLVAIFDEEGTTVWVNEAATALLGWQPQEMIGRPGREFLHEVDRPAAIGFREAAVDHRIHGERTFLIRHQDGSYRSMEVNGGPILLGDGTRGVVLNARDVTDRARSERQLRLALSEDVTGLPNLRMLVAELDAIGDLRPSGLAVTVALVDVERFGDVNVLHGRDAGDRVLRELAGRIELGVPEALGIWRHGADEFAVVLIDDGDAAPTASADLVERLRGAWEDPVVLDEEGGRVGVRMAVGITRLDLDDRVGGERLGPLLLRQAEAALLEAKTHPDRIRIDAAPPGARADRARLVAELDHALDSGGLVVHYQPKVRLHDLGIAAVEALVRWQHPTRGLLPPAAFISAAADANLSGRLLRVVLKDALQEARRWSDSGACPPGFAVCVNVSSDDLRRHRFVDDVLAAVEANGVAATLLVVELTEQTLLADPVGARAAVDRLRSSGVRVAIDDFGTGYSTLEHIRTFEVDELKIDKSFVQRLGSSPADEAIVDSVLAITRRIGVPVVAEGIEHVVAYEYLRERGCDLGQGYLFGRPKPAAQIDLGATAVVG